MNTTMTDGANERLDAQIAEALFGQPGMSKMDVADRVRELRGDGPALLVGEQPAPTGQIDAETLWWLQDAINTMAEGGNQSHVRFLQRLHDALSAQPSAGGQGDALAMIGANLRSIMHLATVQAESTNNVTVANIRTEARHALQLLDVALAARQPVGTMPKWFEMVIRDVCELDPEDPGAADTVCIRLLDLRLIMERHALPAQAVDLEQFRPAVCAMGLYAEEPEDVDEAKRLLTLINGKAVGK
ncbi:hypothetical protein A7X93_00400 [Stenotrophomonas maltophilia]|uniref:hypothetical protein n=1 Tax=Stenotrophomonas maltophilia TaxID=40324 RepID=UPI000DA97C88|nr:hypothetical protein [Stenotrophomonas maltophilia]PZT35102.1 hypothetical protein A7X93_00400 [Stenotrophomonas maltophilia]